MRKGQQPWNGLLPHGLVWRRIALRQWRTTYAALACFNFTAVRLGFEAQNAAAFRLLRLAGGITKPAADEIVPEAVVPSAQAFGGQFPASLPR